LIKKGIERHFKVSVFIILAITSIPLVFQPNIYGQEGSQRLSRAVILADLEPRVASNATGIAVFELNASDLMSYTVNASGISDIRTIALSHSTGGRFTDIIQFHSATRDGVIPAPINGTVASGNFTSADFTGNPLRGSNMLDLLNRINNGEMFVRIGTTARPLDEISGRLIIIF
jgi:hypothetical protein